MKKSALILLLSIYTVAVFGIGVRMYYCCGRLESVTFSMVEQKAAKGSESASSSCCKTRYAFFKVHDSHMASAGLSHFADLLVLAMPQFLPNGVPTFTDHSGYVANPAHAPPRSSLPPFYLLHGNYRV